jgi:predicted RNA binding protein YcfA (HicA-like mRNA interferase family)
MARMPQVSARELVRFLKSPGFVEDRQSGAHLTLRHSPAAGLAEGRRLHLLQHLVAHLRR